MSVQNCVEVVALRASLAESLWLSDCDSENVRLRLSGIAEVFVSLVGKAKPFRKESGKAPFRVTSEDDRSSV